MTRKDRKEKRQETMKEMLAETGDDCHIEPPVNADRGCHLENKKIQFFHLFSGLRIDVLAYHFQA
jgi:hypothetical protein